MGFLRTRGVETGCCSLRQVTIIDANGIERPEAYSHGYFLSLRHLEQWAHHHASHLAIYKQAMADRKKYRERLELCTYHEVFALPKTDHVSAPNEILVNFLLSGGTMADSLGRQYQRTLDFRPFPSAN